MKQQKRSVKKPQKTDEQYLAKQISEQEKTKNKIK